MAAQVFRACRHRGSAQGPTQDRLEDCEVFYFLAGRVSWGGDDRAPPLARAAERRQRTAVTCTQKAWIDISCQSTFPQPANTCLLNR